MTKTVSKSLKSRKSKYNYREETHVLCRQSPMTHKFLANPKKHSPIIRIRKSRPIA